MKIIRLTVASLVLSLASCSLSSTYVQPELPAGPQWQSGALQSAAQARIECWWLTFEDPNLDKLVSVVISRNNNLLLAANEAYRAQLNADIAANGLLPSLGGGLSVDKPLGVQKPSGSSGTLNSNASLEIDIWGKLAAKKDKAGFEAYATAEDYGAARLFAIDNTVRAYFEIAHANESLASAKASLAHVKRIQAIVRGQVAAGAASDLELRQAEQKVEELAAAVSSRKQDLLVVRNELVVLLNGAPNPVSEPGRLPSKKLPPITPGLPAELLARRPDLRAAEARLRATLKQVDQTRAGLYPSISITAALRASSPRLLELISAPAASVAAAMSFLDLKNMNLVMAVSKEEYDKQVLMFRNTLLNAFSEVANTLGERANNAEQIRRHRNGLIAAQEIEQLQEAKYLSGGIALQTLLDSQESRRAAEITLAASRLSQLRTESKLYRIIGGGPERDAPSCHGIETRQRSNR
ncbi:efflux transporter outer membrane subunit [Rhizobium johnstonii]|uniref:efflux transporter outer membrane subunit n=1 Tax=Rhizobium johnstonii TaxID=3019933 RepID=UPI003F9955E0